MSPLAYSIPMAAEATGLSESALKRAIAEGLLKAKTNKVRDDGRPSKRVILAADLQAYLDALEDA